MSRTEGVVFALGHSRKAAYAAHLAVCGEEVASARDDLMGVGLMAHIPHQLIVRGVIDVVYGDRKLHRAQTRGQVARIARTLLDDVLAQLAAVAWQLVDRQLLELGGRIDLVEQIVLNMFHSIFHHCLALGAAKIRFIFYLSNFYATEQAMPRASTLWAICISSSRPTFSSVWQGVSRSSE